MFGGPIEDTKSSGALTPSGLGWFSSAPGRGSDAGGDRDLGENVCFEA